MKNKIGKSFKERKWDDRTFNMVKVLMEILNKEENPMTWDGIRSELISESAESDIESILGKSSTFKEVFKDDLYKWTTTRNEFCTSITRSYNKEFIKDISNPLIFEDAKFLTALKKPYLLPYLYGVNAFEKADGSSYVVRIGKTAYIAASDRYGFDCYGCGPLMNNPLEYSNPIKQNGKKQGSKLEKLLQGAQELVLAHSAYDPDCCGGKGVADRISEKRGIKKVYYNYFDYDYLEADREKNRVREEQQRKSQKSDE